MEYINKIELKGIVGRAITQTINGQEFTKFSLVTEHACKTADGAPAVEAEWFTVRAFNGPKSAANGLQRGDAVRVVGRVRTARYLAPDGTDKTVSEVVASEVEIVEKNVYGL